MIFDDIKRTYTGPAKYQESNFIYYNRSASPEAICGRTAVEYWYTVYKNLHTKEEAKDVRERFRSNDDSTHQGALTELYLHNFLVEHEAKITLHPNTGVKTSHPDFLAESNSYQPFYLEATVVSDSAKEVKQRRYISAISDTVDEIASPDFFINIHIKQQGEWSSLKSKLLKQQLQFFINGLNYDQVCKKFYADKNGPTFLWNEQGWIIKFEASPVSDEGRQRRTVNSRNVGATLNSAHLIRLEKRIQSAVESKLNKYGDLPLPLIIGVNLIGQESIFLDDDSIPTVFYGDPTVTFKQNIDGTTSTTSGRTGKGVLSHPGQSTKNTRLSGLLVIDNLGVWNADTFQKKKLWINPAAKHPMHPQELEVNCMIYDTDTKKFQQSIRG